MVQSDKICRRCGKGIELDPVRSAEVFEGMHWLCFHLEFEHDGDPDRPCADFSCPWWRIEQYEEELRRLGRDPAKVLDEAIKKACGWLARRLTSRYL